MAHTVQPSGQRVLVVDDVTENIQLIGTILRENGFLVSIAQSGVQALGIIRHNPPDLILLDILMPEMDGYETCRRLKQDPATADIPVIFLSGLTEIEDKVEGFKAGAVDYVTKPIEPEELIVRINTHLTVGSLQRELAKINATLEEKVKTRTLQLAEKHAALVNSEEKYRILVENAMEGIFVVQDRRIRFFNPKFKEINGHDREELLSLDYHALVHPDDRGALAKRYDRRMRGEEVPAEYTFRIVDKHGKVRWVETKDVIIDWEGAPALLVVTSDITERHLAEEMKAEHIRLLSLSAETGRALTSGHDLPDMLRQCCQSLVQQLGAAFARIWTMNEERKCLRLQASAGIYTGLAGSYSCIPLEETNKIGSIALTGKPQLTNDVGGDPHILDHRWARRENMVAFAGHPLVVGRKVVGVMALFSRKPLAPITIDVLASVADEIAIGILRRQAEEALIKSEEKYRTLIETTDTGYVILDGNGSVLDANGVYVRMTGHEHLEEILGRSVEEWVAGPDRLKHRRELARCLTQGYVTTLNIDYVDAAGGITPIEANGKTVTTESGPVILALCRDISERIRIEEEKERLESQLQQAQKMEAVGTLAGGIAHDFNNILTPILGYGDMLREEIPADSPQGAYLSHIINAAHRARELVGQILSFSRQAEQDRRPVEVGLIVKEVLKLLRASIPSTIEIRQDIMPECGLVLADSTQIHQVLMNLCTNAYHAMQDRGGILAVSLGAVEIDRRDGGVCGLELTPGSYLRLAVSDTGHGMNRATMERIFEPYFTTKKKGAGSGIGLSVVHGIIKSHGGHISVYSEPDKGTAFHVYLPRITAEQQERSDEGGEEMPRGSERILLVDDEEIIVLMEKKMLEDLGYRVTALMDSRETLHHFERRPAEYDLVITDMTMPHLTGAQLACNLQAIRPDIPVILCSGFSELINEEKARSLGISHYIMKPIVKRDLANIVRKVLDENLCFPSS